MAKIAVVSENAIRRGDPEEAPGSLRVQLLARGEGWSVEDVLCTCGPRDRPYQERHSKAVIAVVMAGTFQYRGDAGAKGELMTPGSLMLGNVGQCFECGHEHGRGDRCLSFGYSPEYFERIASGVGAGRSAAFPLLRVPPLRTLSALTASAYNGLACPDGVSWEELGIRLAVQSLQLARALPPGGAQAPAGATARVTRSVREMEQQPEAPWTLAALANGASLSPFHFLRTFEAVTGVTPHQYLLRLRLRLAAARLASEPARILDIALDSGFGDVSNFNRSFREEFGMSPRAYRKQMRREL